MAGKEPKLDHTAGEQQVELREVGRSELGNSAGVEPGLGLHQQQDPGLVEIQAGVETEGIEETEDLDLGQGLGLEKPSATSSLQAA